MRKFGAIHRETPPERLRAGRKLLAGYDPSPQVDYTDGMVFDGSQALANDTLSDCVPAAFAQLARIRWRIISGEDYQPTAKMVTTLYSDWAGYIPGFPDSDVGTDVLDALDQWATHGIWIKPRPQLLDIGPWFAAPPTNQHMIEAAVDYGIGALLTLALRDGDDVLDDWLAQPGADVIGIHEVVCVGYDPDVALLLTWGKIVRCYWPGLIQRCLSVAVPVSRLMTDAEGQTAKGQTWAEALATLDSILGPAG